jgi:hypothetical protein
MTDGIVFSRRLAYSLCKMNKCLNLIRRILKVNFQSSSNKIKTSFHQDLFVLFVRFVFVTNNFFYFFSFRVAGPINFQLSIINFQFVK